MRYLLLSLLHFASVLCVFSPIVLFALDRNSQLPMADQGFFLGLGIYWFFIPCFIGIICGLLIDGVSKAWAGKAYYSDSKWPKTWRRTIFWAALGGAMIYLHFRFA